jgi:hypothetical protein
VGFKVKASITDNPRRFRLPDVYEFSASLNLNARARVCVCVCVCMCFGDAQLV